MKSLVDFNKLDQLFPSNVDSDVSLVVAQEFLFLHVETIGL